MDSYLPFIIDFLINQFSYLAFLFLVPLCMIILLSFRQSSVSKNILLKLSCCSLQICLCPYCKLEILHHPSSKYHRLVYYSGTFPLGDVLLIFVIDYGLNTVYI